MDQNFWWFLCRGGKFGWIWCVLQERFCWLWDVGLFSLLFSLGICNLALGMSSCCLLGSLGLFLLVLLLDSFSFCLFLSFPSSFHLISFWGSGVLNHWADFFLHPFPSWYPEHFWHCYRDIVSLYMGSYIAESWHRACGYICAGALEPF